MANFSRALAVAGALAFTAPALAQTSAKPAAGKPAAVAPAPTLALPAGALAAWTIASGRDLSRLCETINSVSFDKKFLPGKSPTAPLAENPSDINIGKPIADACKEVAAVQKSYDFETITTEWNAKYAALDAEYKKLYENAGKIEDYTKKSDENVRLYRAKSAAQSELYKAKGAKDSEYIKARADGYDSIYKRMFPDGLAITITLGAPQKPAELRQ
jgi:hypothetical protein